MKDKKNLIINITVGSLTGLLILFIILLLYVPKFSKAVTGVSSYHAISNCDSTLKKHDILIVKDKPFDDLVAGDIILFKLKGYGDNDGLKAYRVMTKPDPEYYHVHSTGSNVSFPWNVTEEMYIGVVSSRIPVLGAVTGFLGSPYGIGVLLVNGVVIGLIVYLVKMNKKEEEKKNKKTILRSSNV